MVMIKGWRDGTAYYLATDNPESVAAFAALALITVIVIRAREDKTWMEEIEKDEKSIRD